MDTQVLLEKISTGAMRESAQTLASLPLADQEEFMKEYAAIVHKKAETVLSDNRDLALCLGEASGHCRKASVHLHRAHAPYH